MKPKENCPQVSWLILLFSTKIFLPLRRKRSARLRACSPVVDGKIVYAGNEFANGIISDLFQIKVQKKKPNQAGLAVPYKGYWFYIDETDISSKRTIGVLNSLVRLKIKAVGSQNIPVLTLPISQ